MPTDKRFAAARSPFRPTATRWPSAAGPFGKVFDAQTGHLRRTLRDESLIADSDGWNGLPADQREKLGSIERAHGSVHCVAFSPDGSWLATSGGHIFEATGATRGALKLWDAKTGECEHDLGEHFGAVFSAAFSPDGKALASVGKHPPAWTASVRLWEPEDGRVVSVLRVSRGHPRSVAFSPDGKLLAAGGIVHNSEDDSTSGMLLIWNARTGALLLNRPRPSLVASVAFSADGKTLAVGEYERGVTLWDPETLNQKGEIQPQTDLPHDFKGTVRVAFSPRGSLLAIGAENEKGGFLSVWDLGQP